MESQLNQAGTFAAQNYADSFFRELPTDSRFLQVSYQKFPPTSSLDSDTIEFSLNRFSAANIYQIQNTCVSLQVVILKTKDNSVPDKDKNVTIANNILHTVFETVRLKINDQLITKSASSYPYKAYITNTLTYSTIAKNAQLQSEGYYADLSAHMEPGTNNGGFEERSMEPDGLAGLTHLACGWGNHGYNSSSDLFSTTVIKIPFIQIQN